MKALIRTVWILGLIALAGCGGSGGSKLTTANVAFLYVIGQGQNTIQGFHIQGSGDLVGTSVSSITTNPRPVAMALHPSTNFLYVANFTSNTVSGYTVDHTAGVLAPVGQALSPTPTGPLPIAVGCDSGGHFLFVLNQGDNTISVYSVDGARGLLTQVGAPFPTGLANPVAMNVSPTSSFLYVLSGPAPSTINVFSFDTNGVLASAAGSFLSTGSTNIAGMTIDAKGQFLYAADSANNGIVSLSIAPSGALAEIAGSPFPAGTQPVAVAVDATGSFVYASNAGSNNISGYTSKAGVLTQVSGSPFTTEGTGTITATQPGFLTVDVTNTFLYVSNVATRGIAAFGINAADGTLVEVSNSPFPEVVAPSWIVTTK